MVAVDGLAWRVAAAVMLQERQGPNPEVARIVNEVLGDLSLDQAAIHLRYGLSKEAIRIMRQGKVGREPTIRTFAQGFWTRFCEKFGDEIRAEFGECEEKSVSDWFAEKAGYGRRHIHRLAPAPPLTYTPDEDTLSEFRPRGYDELTRGLQPEDLELAERLYIETLRGLRRRAGLEE